MSPLVRRTWGLRGVTPALPCRTRAREKVSGLGALVVSPKRRRITLYLALHPKKNIKGPQVVTALRHLRRHHRGPAVLLWDRGRPHRHRWVTQALAAHPSWHVEWLPPYTPELNPVEQVWTYLKYGRLANWAPTTVAAIHQRVRRESGRVAHRPPLLKSFFHHSQLPFCV